MTLTLLQQKPLIQPHGGALVNRYLTPPQAAAWKKEWPHLPNIALSHRQLSDLDMIAQGAYSPLEGFMAQKEYLSVVDSMHLPSGLLWSLPITLAVSQETAHGLREGSPVALSSPDGEPAGVLHLNEMYTYDKAEEAELVFSTRDEAHPGVRNLLQQGDLLLGGPVDVFHRNTETPFPQYYLTPSQTRAAFQERGWNTVVGFQTRNPVHRAHEYIQKCALELVDGLLLHPLVGETKEDDIPAPVRMRCYEALLKGYYPQGRVLLAVLPAHMRYAGPREAIFHALVRKNYGCTHFIVGRDHAGVGSYYGTYDAQHIFKEFSANELGIQPLFFENAFYCQSCGGMATPKTCPHPPEARVSLSGTQVRAMLQKGETPPAEFTRPEVAKILMNP